MKIKSRTYKVAPTIKLAICVNINLPIFSLFNNLLLVLVVIISLLFSIVLRNLDLALFGCTKFHSLKIIN